MFAQSVRRNPDSTIRTDLRPQTRVFSRLVSVCIVIGVLLTLSMTYGAQAADSIPTCAQSTAVRCYGVYHIVRPRQTIYSIAAAYGTTARRIVICNRLASYTVYVGQALLIPIYR